jgi:hypothetical protein
MFALYNTSKLHLSAYVASRYRVRHSTKALSRGLHVSGDTKAEEGRH